MRLNQYHKKRDFSKTTEPKGKVSNEKPRLFIIQKHAASHLHYDFRIELHGVLKSWAIPKGPSLDPHVKRLAMHVEDHPIAYGSFEGVIPKGQYGGGTVMLWDKGNWEPLDSNPNEAYEKGHLRFILHAEKLNGRWDLIRFQDEKHWFLIKYQDEYAKNQDDYDITSAQTKSVLSNTSIEEIAKHHQQIWQNSEKNATPIVLPKGLKKTQFPDFISPQLAALVDKPENGKQWLHEIKLDGYRILAFKNGSKVVLKSRTNNDWTNDLPHIAATIKQLPYEQLVLDGEVVVLDKKSRSDFQLLQNSLHDKTNASLYFLFDLLYFDGFDLRHLPLIERKQLLKNILNTKPAYLHYSEHIIRKGNALYEHACKHGLEGIISKQIDAPYHSKRSKTWLKVKCLRRQEFVIGGYTNPKGEREHFGSLFLGVYNQQGGLNFIGNVGTGFTNQTLKKLHDLFAENQTPKNPFTSRPPGFKQAHWLQPNLVCDVAFSEWTTEGHLRHPSFKGMRLDKKASEVVREDEIPIAEVHSQFKLTNPHKLLYPEDKISKQDLLNYYESISDHILPYLNLRPLTLLRCPSGYEHCFYQRHYNRTTPKALHIIEDKTKEEHPHYIYLNDKQGLLSLVQMGVLEIHPWGSTIHYLEQPNIIVLDLDPAPDVPWSTVVATAKEIRDYFSQYELRSFVKTTGGKGLHVVIPILPEYEWDEVKQFTHIFVQLLERLNPTKYISKMNKAQRGGKIFIDYLRNQRAATAIAPYSTRARIHAPVSTPLSWDELSSRIEDNSYTIKSLPKRLQQLSEDPWKNFWTLQQSLRLDKFD